MNIIEVNNLVKSYKGVEAVKGISFNVEKGELFAFLGPNGAGKSTTINIISTLLSLDKGEVTVSGSSVGSEDDSIRSNIGIVFQNSILDDILTVRENLEVRGSFYNLSKKDIKIKIKKIVELLSMETFIDRRYGKLSGGQRRKADIARALINSPEILILDEPTTGLDPKSRKTIWETIKGLKEKENMTIFLTTHYMEETNIADNVVIIDNGKIVASGTPEELKTKYSYDIIRIIPKDSSIEDVLINDKLDYIKDRDTFKIKLKSSFDGIDIANKYREYISNFEILIGDMDDVFLNITGKDLESGEENE